MAVLDGETRDTMMVYMWRDETQTLPHEQDSCAVTLTRAVWGLIEQGWHETNRSGGLFCRIYLEIIQTVFFPMIHMSLWGQPSSVVTFM